MLKDGVNGVDGLDGARGVKLSADGNFAYVIGNTDDAVSWYQKCEHGSVNLQRSAKGWREWSGRLGWCRWFDALIGW